MATADTTGTGTQWESSDERRQRIGQLTRAQIKRHKPSDTRSLHDALTTGGLITRRELRALPQRLPSPVISLYLTLAPDPPAPQVAPLTAFHSLRHTVLAARQAFVDGLDRYAQMRLEHDLDELAEFVEHLEQQGMRSIVVFKCGGELNRVFRLPLPLHDRLLIDPEPYVEPLDVLLETHSKALVVALGKEHTDLRTHQLGDEQPVGEVRAREQSHLHWHLRASVQAMAALFKEYDCEVSVLEGDEAVTAEFVPLLPQTLRATVIGTLHPSPGAGDADRSAAVEDALARRREQVETSALEELGLFQGHDLLVSGLPAVLASVNQFRGRRVFVSDALALPGFICHEHHYLSLEPGRCPFDDTHLVPSENVVDDLIAFAHHHGVDILVAERRRDMLDSHDGIAAVLYPPA